MGSWGSGQLNMGASLQLSRATACSRGFFERMGFEWLDPPLNQQGHKSVMPPQRGCDCGACAGGVLSRRMNEKLHACADQ
jgi:hypothetical protein